MPTIFISGKTTFKVKPADEKQKKSFEKDINDAFYALDVSYTADGVSSRSDLWKSFLKKGEFEISKEGDCYLVNFDGVLKNSFGQRSFDAVLQTPTEIMIRGIKCEEGTIPVDGEIQEIQSDLKFSKTAPKKW